MTKDLKGREVNSVDLTGIKSMQDEKAVQMASNAPEGVHPYYHVIGLMGGNAVKDKYKNYGTRSFNEEEMYTGGSYDPGLK